MPVSVLSTFLITFLAMVAASLVGWRWVESLHKKHVAAILKTVSGEAAKRQTKILRDTGPHARSPVEWVLAHFDLARHMEANIKQAGMDSTPGQLLILTMALGLIGGLCGAALPLSSSRTLRAGLMGALGAALPYLYVRRKRKRRLAAFEEQLPDALDFLARSMRAGHAFSAGLEMLSEEMADPLGLEFRTLFHEHNLGATMESSLQNLTERVPLLDVRFFTSAVTMQRQTGGNLGEILMRLAHVIRERFRLKGQVKAASAHGRLTATILTAMPIVTMVLLMVVAPGYLEGMAKDPDGKYLIGGSIVGQMLGYLVIRKIINIKV